MILADKIIEEKNQDKELANRIIKTELSGIFNWIIDGLKRLLNQKNFTYSSAIDKAILSYKRSSDSILLFLSENHYQKNIHLVFFQNLLYFVFARVHQGETRIEFGKIFRLLSIFLLNDFLYFLIGNTSYTISQSEYPPNFPSILPLST